LSASAPACAAADSAVASSRVLGAVAAGVCTGGGAAAGGALAHATRHAAIDALSQPHNPDRAARMRVLLSATERDGTAPRRARHAGRPGVTLRASACRPAGARGLPDREELR